MPYNFFSFLPFLTANSVLHLPFSIDFIMLRRKPTRLELKLDDIEEFESIRKDLEVSTTFKPLGIFKTVTLNF